MALLRNTGRKREELLSSYDGEEPYMPGGYDTPYDGEEPYMPEGYDSPYDDDDDGDYADDYDGDYDDYGDYDDDYLYDDSYGDGSRYGDDYRDGSRYDDDYGYDDAYGYDGDDYPEDDGDYDRRPYYDDRRYAPEADYASEGGLLGYLDGHDWPTWVALVLLPPVGIWLLWRRLRFSSAVNATLSVLSALWLAAVIAVLVLQPFKQKSDTTITPQPVGASALPAAARSDEETEAEAEAAPTEAPARLVPTEEVDEANAVYTVSGTPYYHQNETCQAIGEGGETVRTSRNAAIEQSLMACPYCMGSQYSDGLWDLAFVTAETEDMSNITVFCSAFNTHFHTNATCSDISGDAHEVGLKDALLMGKSACDVCCPQAATLFYCTVDGNYYHVDDECSGMRNASHVTYAEARVTGKKRCPVCIGGEDETATALSEDDAAAEAEAAGYYVYATPKGTYYHVNSTCSGMKNAQQVLLSDMLKQNRPACPTCCPDAESIVFAESGNPYFHSYATCSGMTNATQGILVNALAAGLSRCPVCWTQETGANATGDGDAAGSV